MRKPAPLTHIAVLVAFMLNSFGIMPSAQAQTELRLPKPGVMVHLSPPMNPPMLKGIKVDANNPFRFEFVMDQGDSHPDAKGSDKKSHPERSEGSLKKDPSSHKNVPQDDIALKQEANRLIKYFLAAITVPEKDLWVNLSPYEKDRIIPNSFGLTEMGRDLLAEDYMLKQITASLIYPEDEVGKKFWKRIYEESAKKYGTTNIPVNTFNKVWIVPEKAVVYENAKVGTAYVVESRLKVMLAEDYESLAKSRQNKNFGGLEGDYLSLNRHSERSEESIKKDSSSYKSTPQEDTHALGSKIIREIVIPELTREINTGANFAKLRQVYNSLILATWYKKKIKDSILSQVYADKNKIEGIGYQNIRNSNIRIFETRSNTRINQFPKRFENLNFEELKFVSNIRTFEDSRLTPEKIYNNYLLAFKKGVYNYIKEDIDPITQQSIPRKYFSGGFDAALITPTLETAPASKLPLKLDRAQIIEVELNTADFAQIGTFVETKLPFIQWVEKLNGNLNLAYGPNANKYLDHLKKKLIPKKVSTTKDSQLKRIDAKIERLRSNMTRSIPTALPKDFKDTKDSAWSNLLGELDILNIRAPGFSDQLKRMLDEEQYKYLPKQLAENLLDHLQLYHSIGSSIMPYSIFGLRPTLSYFIEYQDPRTKKRLVKVIYFSSSNGSAFEVNEFYFFDGVYYGYGHGRLVENTTRFQLLFHVLKENRGITGLARDINERRMKEYAYLLPQEGSFEVNDNQFNQAAGALQFYLSLGFIVDPKYLEQLDAYLNEPKVQSRKIEDHEFKEFVEGKYSNLFHSKLIKPVVGKRLLVPRVLQKSSDRSMISDNSAKEVNNSGDIFSLEDLFSKEPYLEGMLQALASLDQEVRRSTAVEFANYYDDEQGLLNFVTALLLNISQPIGISNWQNLKQIRNAREAIIFALDQIIIKAWSLNFESVITDRIKHILLNELNQRSNVNELSIDEEKKLISEFQLGHSRKLSILENLRLFIISRPNGELTYDSPVKPWVYGSITRIYPKIEGDEISQFIYADQAMRISTNNLIEKERILDFPKDKALLVDPSIETPIDTIPEGSTKVEQDGRILYMTPKAVENMKQLDEFAADRDYVAEIAGFGLTKRLSTDTSGQTSVLVDFISPREGKVFVIPEFIQFEQTNKFAQALAYSKTLEIKLQSEKVFLLSDDHDLSFELNELDWNLLYKYVGSVVSVKVPIEYEELKDMLQKMQSLEINLDWDLIVTGASVKVTRHYYDQVKNRANIEHALPDFTMHHHPRLGLAVAAFLDKPIEKREEYYQIALGYSLGDLTYMNHHDVKWFEIRMLGEADNIESNTSTTSRFYHMDDLKEKVRNLGKLIKEMLQMRNDEATPESIYRFITDLRKIDPGVDLDRDLRVLFEYILGEEEFKRIKETYSKLEIRNLKDYVLQILFNRPNQLKEIGLINLELLRTHVELDSFSIVIKVQEAYEKANKSDLKYFDKVGFWSFIDEKNSDQLRKNIEVLQLLLINPKEAWARVSLPIKQELLSLEIPENEIDQILENESMLSIKRIIESIKKRKALEKELIKRVQLGLFSSKKEDRAMMVGDKVKSSRQPDVAMSTLIDFHDRIEGATIRSNKDGQTYSIISNPYSSWVYLKLRRDKDSKISDGWVVEFKIENDSIEDHEINLSKVKFDNEVEDLTGQGLGPQILSRITESLGVGVRLKSTITNVKTRKDLVDHYVIQGNDLIRKKDNLRVVDKPEDQIQANEISLDTIIREELNRRFVPSDAWGNLVFEAEGLKGVEAIKRLIVTANEGMTNLFTVTASRIEFKDRMMTSVTDGAMSATKYIFEFPHLLNPIIFESLYKDHHNEKGFKYLLYYMVSSAGVPEKVRSLAQEYIDKDNLFPIQHIVREQIKDGFKKVLIFHNFHDRMGDELMRVGTLIQGLLNFNPNLEVTIITSKPYLYDHPRIKVISSDKERLNIGVEEDNYDALFDFSLYQEPYEPLERVFREKINLKKAKIYVRIDKQIFNFSPSAFVVNGTDYLKLFKTDQELNANFYSPIYKLIAELGLPLRFAEDKPINGSFINNVDYPEAHQQWEELMQKLGNMKKGGAYNYPVVLINPFGGENANKGFRLFSDEDIKKFHEIIKKFVSGGYKILILPNGQQWGTKSDALKLIEGLPQSLVRECYVLNEPSADQRIIKYFVGYSDYILTVEGGMMHLAYLMGKPFGAIIKYHPKIQEPWVPFARSPNQRIFSKDDDDLLPKISLDSSRIKLEESEDNVKKAGDKSQSSHQSDRAIKAGDKRGGIDFTANKTPLEVQNAAESIKFNVDPAVIKQLQNAPGFYPVIINITPINNLRDFLGVNEAKLEQLTS